MARNDNSNIPDYFPGDLPKFRIGQVVEHSIYGYRGVIVDFDMSCRAEDDWYESNKIHPDKEQPWYHILVHRSNGNVYVAEENLVAIDNQEPVDHPLMPVFFEAFMDGWHVRNDEHWFGWDQQQS